MEDLENLAPTKYTGMDFTIDWFHMNIQSVPTNREDCFVSQLRYIEPNENLCSDIIVLLLPPAMEHGPEIICLLNAKWGIGVAMFHGKL